MTNIREFFLDNSGMNKMIMHHSDKTIVLYIQLQAGRGRKRKIGVVTKSTETIIIKRNREKHLFRKMDAYGFNQYILENTKSFKTVWLKDDFSDWKIPVSFILQNGEYMNFKREGFELQRFVSLESIEQFRVKKSENRRF